MPTQIRVMSVEVEIRGVPGGREVSFWKSWRREVWEGRMSAAMTVFIWWLTLRRWFGAVEQC